MAKRTNGANGHAKKTSKKTTKKSRSTKAAAPFPIDVEMAWFSRMAERLTSRAGKMARYELTEIAKRSDKALKAMYLVVEAFADVPKDWEKPKGVGAGVLFVVGAEVGIKEAALPKWEEVLGGNPVLTIEKIVGSKFVCIDKTGMKVLVPRSNLAKIASA